MSFETLNYEVANNVATITFNRPEAANAMDPLMAKEFGAAAIDADDDPAVRAVVLTGAGKMFCAGGDLGAFAQAGEGTRKLLMQMTGDLHLGLSRLARSKAPVIGAVNGTAAGAGFSLVMACDLAIAAESAVFTMAYTRAGLSPDGSSTYYMPRKIGDRRTRELMLTNRLLSSQEALDWGIVNQVVADAELLGEAQGLAQQLASGPTAAFAAVKTLLNGTFEQTLESQMELEARAIAGLAAGHDGQEGISAFFEKRKPAFTGA
ncbi:MAG: enoyl-CoA hydratase-related protein [Gammaproteobacteria bacterium]|nr:enoyl-CoA hydratase-related protein [Gammaproteobacteria bacterium]MDD9964361.1 enoyl-CoA hydratase-related protein [Gammaproteobacteria bacterium]MDE0272317.1 enoyl-CoA hydratase-related protein [Gammaproteobacteria bacterium]